MAAVTTTPPAAPTQPTERVHHGDRFVDDYAWMSDRDDPRFRSLIEQENAYTDQQLRHLGRLRDTLLGELRSHIQETDVTVPVRMGSWWYVTRTFEGRQYPVFTRLPATPDGARPDPVVPGPVAGEQTLLDGNAEAAGQPFFSLGGLEVSADGRYLAALVDRTGDERFALTVRDLTIDADPADQVIDDVVTGAGYGLVWSKDASVVFYTRLDDAWRQFQVWRHTVGTPVEQDRLVVTEPDELFTVDIEASSDERWMVVGARSTTTAQAWLVDLAEPQAHPRVVHPREHGLDYTADVDGDRLLVVHNGDRRDFEVAVAPLSAPGREHWVRLLAGEDTERVLGVQAFGWGLAVAMRSRGLPTVRTLRRTPDGYGTAEPTGLDSPARVVELGDNPAYDTDGLQLTVESMVTPRSVYQLAAGGGGLQLLRRRPVPGYDPSRYTESRVWVTAADGVRVPMSVAHRVDVRPDGGNPGFLYGYGSYEISTDPRFNPRRISWLDRGAVVALAHVRGGGELGRGWYEDGKLLSKRNTFTDFVACGRWLVDSGWVGPDRLVAEGGSAGGLLIGAAINQDPSLFAAVHAAVPFVDALTTILDPSMPLTVGEWEEWGNPLDDPEVYAYMKSYTPYENIAATRYPAILATTSLNDTRVMCTEPAKWVQQLRRTVTNDETRPILLKTEIVAGHGGRSGRYDVWEQQALQDAFLMDQARCG